MRPADRPLHRYPASETQSYRLDRATQFSPTPKPDILPGDQDARAAYARYLAMDAAIYGLPCVLQHREMVRQAVDATQPRYVGFNRFVHDRDLAGPGYPAFKSPNSDTLYSNAWLDLTQAPVLITTPDVGLLYYTLQLLDMHANASNIGTRTYGNKAGRYLVASAAWDGEVPTGAVLFRVATPTAWVLMRVFAQNADEISLARSIQNRVTITPLGPPSDVSTCPLIDDLQAPAFFKALDHVIRTNGVPEQEDALVYRFRAIGLGAPKPFDHAGLDPDVRAGLEAGFADAMQIIASSRSQLGIPTGTGWNKVEKARYGFNYLSRAVTNFVGLGANVEEENYSFNTFTDGQGVPLDGSTSRYALEITPPPVDAFWSLTLYDGSNFELFPNVIGRYLISDRQPAGQSAPDGRRTIVMQHKRPDDVSNWLPAPAGPFYLAFRAYLPKPEMLAGAWQPNAIVRLAG